MSPTSRTPECAHKGTFWCSLFPSLVSNTRKCPHGCSHTSPLPSPSRTPECARTGTFWCSHTSPLPLPRLEHQNEPVCGSFWCSHTSPLPLPHLEHQNEPVWARSGACAPPLFLSLVSSIRTSPHGLG